MDAETKRADSARGDGRMRALAVHTIRETMVQLAELLHAAAHGLEQHDPKGSSHVRAAARMVEGVDSTAPAEDYLRAVRWTLEQVSIELKDVTGGDACTQQIDPEV